MCFESFYESRRYYDWDDAPSDIRDQFESGHPLGVIVFDGGVFLTVERGGYSAIVGNVETVSEKLRDVAMTLYEYAQDEGMIDLPDPQEQPSRFHGE